MIVTHLCVADLVIGSAFWTFCLPIENEVIGQDVFDILMIMWFFSFLSSLMIKQTLPYNVFCFTAMNSFCWSILHIQWNLLWNLMRFDRCVWLCNKHQGQGATHFHYPPKYCPCLCAIILFPTAVDHWCICTANHWSVVCPFRLPSSRISYNEIIWYV